MDDPQSDNGSEDIFDFPIKRLEDILITMTENIQGMINAQGMANKFQITDFTAKIYSKCKKCDKKPIQYKDSIKIRFYNYYSNDDVMDCYSHSKLSRDKIQCTHYSSKSTFELSNSLQNILNILYSGILTYMNKQHIFTSITVFTDLNTPPKENPKIVIKNIASYLLDSKISKETYLFIYDNDRSFITMVVGHYNPSKFNFFRLY
jgi:hypothetical protein